MSCNRLVMVAAGLLLGLLQNAVAQTPPPWPQELFNPSADPTDLVLPMPCGGAMAFRRIDVPDAGPLADQKVVLGGVDDRFAITEDRRFEYIAGSFSDPKVPDRRFFYLGKYEINQLQYSALGGNCVAPERRGRLPQVEVNWHDAVDYARKYTEWLTRSMPGQLPTEKGGLGFMRLPTEAEWEFAARGGVSVTPSQFEEPLPPMPEGLQKYVWFQGSTSANGRLQLTGLLKGNPLGLHDMLGNADEIVLDAFRLNKFNRLHGQAGGYVVKGGNYLTSQGDVRAAYRQEYEHFDRNGPRRSRSTGFRLAIAAPAITSRDQLDAVRKAWADLPRRIAISETQEVADPIAEVDAILQNTTDEDARRRTQAVRLALNRYIDNESQLRGRAARSLMRAGALLANKLRDDQALLVRSRDLLRVLRASQAAPANLSNAETSVARNETILKDTAAFYSDMVSQVARDFREELVTKELQSLAVEYESRQQPQLRTYAETFVRHVTTYRRTGLIETEKWLEDYRSR